MVVRFKPTGERPVRPAVRVIVVNPTDDTILLCKRFCKHTGALLTYDLPGGGIESGESIADAAIKECLEEVGVRVKDPQELGVTSSYPFDPAGGDWHYIYSQGEDHYTWAKFDGYDSTKFHSEGDSMSYDWVLMREILQKIQDGPENASNSTRIKALEKVVTMFMVYG